MLFDRSSKFEATTELTIVCAQSCCDKKHASKLDLKCLARKAHYREADTFIESISLITRESTQQRVFAEHVEHCHDVYDHTTAQSTEFKSPMYVGAMCVPSNSRSGRNCGLPCTRLCSPVPVNI